MIREVQVDKTIGCLALSIVQNKDDYFFVSTVNLALRRIFDVMAEWRDDWWLPPYTKETMIWKCDKVGSRSGESLHCQGYRKSASALTNHKKLCKQIELRGVDTLNGRQFQTQKLDKERIPNGLFKDIERKTRGLFA